MSRSKNTRKFLTGKAWETHKERRQHTEKKDQYITEEYVDSILKLYNLYCIRHGVVSETPLPIIHFDKAFDFENEHFEIGDYEVLAFNKNDVFDNKLAIHTYKKEDHSSQIVIVKYLNVSTASILGMMLRKIKKACE